MIQENTTSQLKLELGRLDAEASLYENKRLSATMKIEHAKPPSVSSSHRQAHLIATAMTCAATAMTFAAKVYDPAGKSEAEGFSFNQIRYASPTKSGTIKATAQSKQRPSQL